MKCPNCSIYYDDDDRECPMCGARRPSQTARKPVIHHQRTQERTTAQPAQATMRPALSAEQKQRTKSSRGPLVLVVVIFVLIQLAAFVFSAAQEHTAAVPEPDPQGAFVPGSIAPYMGLWQDGAGMQFALSHLTDDYGDPLYVLTKNEQTEFGYYYAAQYTQAEGAEFPAQFPADQFDCWTLSLVPTNADADEDAMGMILMYQSKADPETAYFFSANGLPENAVPMASSLDPDEAAKMIYRLTGTGPA